MPIQLRNENVPSNFDKMDYLLDYHWDEVAKNKELMVLAPDYAKYRTLSDMGKLIGIYAYDEDVMVGYSVNIIDTHLHYKNLLACSNDVLFLSKEYRNSTVGLRLKKETEKVAKAQGAQIMLWHAKEGSSLSLILQTQKYDVQDIVYSKTLA